MSSSSHRIFILDTPRGELAPLADAFRSADNGGEVVAVGSTRELLEAVEGGRADMVVIDETLGDGKRPGLLLLGELRALDPELPIVAVAESGDVARAARAIEAGATDFLVRNTQLDDRVSTQLAKIRQLLHLVRKNRALESENRELRSAHAIVGDSPELRKVITKIERVAKVPRPVLIQGERGTGKELVARAIHSASGARGVFLAVNCAAIAEPLLESELFGYERGAFTGAERRTKGKFELATDGTLFFDEVGHMPLGFQQKILRTVEYGSFLRVGGSAEVRVDTRIVAATNADLKQSITAGSFLVDLYDRLAFEVIRVPPLRERRADIPLLAQHFLEQFMREVPAFRGKRLSPEALALLGEHAFPGNVRELKNIIERAVYRDTESVLTPDDLDIAPESHRVAAHGAFKQEVEARERDLIQSALEQARGNQAEAARRLGLTYHQFRYYHAKHFG